MVARASPLKFCLQPNGSEYSTVANACCSAADPDHLVRRTDPDPSIKQK